MEGGEPLLREDVFQLLTLMREAQLEVHLITNGLALSWESLKFLRKNGIKLMISMDGASEATYESIRKGSSFTTVLQAAREAAKEGVLESLNLTLLKANYREIPSLFRLALSLETPAVTILGLKPCLAYEENLLSPEEYEEAIGLACWASGETGVEFFFDEPFFQAVLEERRLSLPQAQGKSGILLGSTSACIFGEYIFIDSEGSVKPCSFSPVSSGCVRAKSLREIWEEMQQSSFLKELKENNKRNGPCRFCPYLLKCGGCRSRTFSLRGDWSASDPVCPLGGQWRASDENPGD